MDQLNEGPSVAEQLKFAAPFGNMVSEEINKIMENAPKDEKAVAMFALVKTLSIIWISTMRTIDMSPGQAIMMIAAMWKSMDEYDENEAKQAGGLH